MAEQSDTTSIIKEIREIIKEVEQANGGYSFINDSYRKPIETLRALIDQEPLLYDAYYLLAQMMRQMDNHHLAISYLKKCYNFKPDNKFLLQEIEAVEANKKQRSIDGLEYQFTRLEKDPKCTTAMGCLASEYTTIGNLEEALNWRIRAIDTEPDNWEHYYSIGWTYRRLKQMDKSIDSFKKALELYNEPIDSENPESDMKPNLNKAIGERYDEIKDHTTAEIYLRTALDLADPSLKKYYYIELGNNLKSQEKYEEAIEFYNLHKASNTDSHYPNLDAIIGHCYYQLNDKAAAKAHYQQCAIDNPANDNSFYCLGVMYSEEDDDESAKMVYQMALQANGNNMSVHYNLGMIAFREKNYRQTVEHLLKVIELDFFNDKAYGMLYHAYSMLTEDEKAEEALMQSIIINEIIKKRKEEE